MNVKFVGSWKNDEQREMLLIIWKIIKLILEARKSSEKAKSLRKKMAKKNRKKKKKQAEKANISLNQEAREKSQ